jgi:hypothetical protein
MIALMCGLTFNTTESRQSWITLVDELVTNTLSSVDVLTPTCSRHFDWIVGFGADRVVNYRVVLAIPRFVELALLRQANDQGNISGTHRPMMEDAVERALTQQDLLNHTSVLVISKATSESTPAIVRELVFSTQDCLWGYPIPACPRCGNAMTTANFNKQSLRYTVKCLGCKSITKGRGVKRPTGVIPINSPQIPEDKLFWKPLGVSSPWVEHIWKCR